MKQILQIVCIVVAMASGIYQSAIPGQEMQEHVEEKARVDFPEGLSGWSIHDLENLQSVSLKPSTQEDIEKIGKITSLKELNISLYQRDQEPIWDLEAIGGLEHLENLTIRGGTEEFNMEPLANLKNVRRISLEGTDFDLSFLAGMEALEELYTDRTGEIVDLSMLAGLKHLRVLDIYYVDEADLCYLEELEALEEIYIFTGEICGFEALENLHKVKSLTLKVSCENEDAPYMDISVLKNMKELTGVTMGGIKIGNIQSLAKLETLEWILLVESDIEDIEALCKMPNLRYLGIYGNESKAVEKQGEQYGDLIWDFKVTDEIPYDFQ